MRSPINPGSRCLLRKKDIPKAIIDSGDDLTEDNINSPMKILINVDHVIEIQKSLISGEKAETDNDAKLSRFVNTLLDNVSNALGALNKFKHLFVGSFHIFYYIIRDFRIYKDLFFRKRF